MSRKDFLFFKSIANVALLKVAFSLALGFSARAEVQSQKPLNSPSCLPDFTALSAVSMLSPNSLEKRIYPLHSENTQGRFITPVEMQVQMESTEAKGGDRLMTLRFRFAEDFSGVSLPFNLFAVLIIQNEQPLLWVDLTSGCQDPGVSFFPGQEWSLPPLRWWSSGGDLDRLQIMVWGRL